MKVISGGQTGVDIAAVRAAKDCGLETGGWMPRGFLNHTGKHPEWKKEFGFKESMSLGYRNRTWANVRESDATLRLAYVFDSPGERCTLKAIKIYNKPNLDLGLFVLKERNKKQKEIIVGEVVTWLEAAEVKILNVAGNSERTAPGIESEAYEFLLMVFKRMREADGTL
jgi:hypothetical protein